FCEELDDFSQLFGIGPLVDIGLRVRKIAQEGLRRRRADHAEDARVHGRVHAAALAIDIAHLVPYVIVDWRDFRQFHQVHAVGGRWWRLSGWRWRLGRRRRWRLHGDRHIDSRRATAPVIDRHDHRRATRTARAQFEHVRWGDRRRDHVLISRCGSERQWIAVRIRRIYCDLDRLPGFKRLLWQRFDGRVLVRLGDAHRELDAGGPAATIVGGNRDSCLTGVVAPQHQHARLVDSGADDVLVTRLRHDAERVAIRIGCVDTKLARLTSGHLLIVDRGDTRVLVRRGDAHCELDACAALTVVERVHGYG